jgi:transposase
MSKSSVGKGFSDPVWPELEAAVAAARHSRAGAPGGLTGREFLEAVRHHNRTGSPWRDLPPELGCWHAVYMRFRRWEARGGWPRLWKNLHAEPFAKARGVLMDSATVRAHQHAAGAPRKRPRPGFGPLSRGPEHQDPRGHHRRELPPICQPRLSPPPPRRRPCT